MSNTYQLFFENLGAGALILSPEGTILYSNESFKSLVNNENNVGTSFLQYIDADYHAIFLENLKLDQNIKMEMTIQPLRGQQISVLGNLSKGHCLMLTDISKLKKGKMLAEASESIVKILHSEPSLSLALEKMIEVFKLTLDWEALIMWTWDEKEQALVCADSASIRDVNIDSLVEASQKSEFKESQMAGLVWSTYRPVWIKDMAEDTSFSRHHGALSSNMHGVFAFPIYRNSQVIGVIELFRRKPLKEDLDDLTFNLIARVGIEIGLYIQRKIAEETANQYSTVFAYSANGIYTTNIDGVVTSWNPGSERIYGWKSNEIIGANIKRTLPLDRVEEFERIWATIRKGQSIAYLETERVHKNGELIWVNISYGPIKNPVGKTVGVCVVVQDIAPHKAALEYISRSEERFRTFVETTGEWIWETDKKGNITFSNDAIFNILGYKTEEILGRNLVDLSFPEDRMKVEKRLLKNIIRKQGWFQETVRALHKEGDERWLESSANVLKNENNEVLGFRGAIRDVTGFVQLDKIKNEFISLVSHELRTPLTSIHGALTLLTNKKFTPEEEKDLINTAQRNSERLTQLINDIIDVEKLELGRFEFNFEKVNIKDVVTDAIKSSEFLINKFEIKIILQVTTTEFEVEGDYQRLIQVMMNLLSNAIKFSFPKGTITVSIESNDIGIKVSIKDEGPGIKEEFRSKVFQKFAQQDSSSKRTYQGTGLGLSICKSIIEAHAGSIFFTTELNKGSTFFFELPKYTYK